MLLAELTATSQAVRASSARTEKIARLAETLRRMGPDEVAIGVAYLSGELRQRQIGVGYRSLRELPPPATQATLELIAVDAACAAIGVMGGPGSQAARRDALAALFARATEPEQRYLGALMTGELRQGAQEGVMVEAITRAAAVPRDAIRRACMLSGDLGTTAAAALTGGVEALRAVGLQVGRPIQPMLAAPGAGVDAALAKTGPAAIEYKLDGARLQVHRRGDEVRAFTRSLDDITARVPEVVEAVLALPARDVVLDGEAIALKPDGRPYPFQVTASRFGTRRADATAPLTPLFFDLLHVDGEDLIDRPGAERAAALDALVPAGSRVPRALIADPGAAHAFLDAALAAGHEGVLVKSLEAPYAAGRRGAGWLKVKPRHTLDLVVLAAEWGHGRRRGRLSNLHLGARDPSGAGFVMLGKTFKGLTDAMLTWQTERLLALEVARDDWTVHVRPELVVEIAFDGVQTSTRYPGGVTLRFARVLRHRPDKSAAEADALDAVLAVHAAGR
ncbi:MAG: ATP-dependent DNA ligase [Solirubrobacteraceae bacterium]